MSPSLPVSPKFLAAVRRSHQIVSRVRVVPPGATGANPQGRDLALVSGSVTLDATADTRGTCDLVVKEYWPETNTTDDLVPYGTEVAVSRGIVYENGNIERVPLGIYRLVTVEQADAPDGAIRLTGSDRMQGIRDARLEEPVSFPPSQTFEEVVELLVNGGATDSGQVVQPVYGFDVTVEWSDGDSAETSIIGRTLVIERDRYEGIESIATTLGKIVFVDFRGILVIKDPPDTTAPVVDVDAGANGVLVSAARTLTREGVYNVVVATGEALDNVAPPLGIAEDDDPSSVTFVDGAFGRVPRFYSSPFITTDAQAESAAGLILEQSRGLPYAVDFAQVPNPALEPLDPVRVVYPITLYADPHVKVEIHVLEQIQVGLGSDITMACTTRLSTNRGV